jgi:hypothetical protein
VPRTVDRFSPLRLLTTPRFRPGQSRLRDNLEREEPVPVFGIASEMRLKGRDAEEERFDLGDIDETIRIALAPRHLDQPEPIRGTDRPKSPVLEDTPAQVLESGPKTVEGVEVEREGVQSAVVGVLLR